MFASGGPPGALWGLLEPPLPPAPRLRLVVGGARAKGRPP